MERTNIFVYGTLKRNQRANHILTDAGAQFLGDCELPGYALYDLGAYPAIRKASYSKVFGELWSIDSDRMAEMDSYESEGSLYDRSKVTVIFSDGEKAEAEAYVYKRIINRAKCPPDCSWPVSDRVWYASYGSNISERRFNCYIEGGCLKENGIEYEGCSDKSHWLDCKAEEISNAEIYFARQSPSWREKGVAFLDSEAKGKSTWSKRDLITKEQFAEVWKQEGINGWYSALVFLGRDKTDGNPIFSFTEGTRSPENEPDPAYLELIAGAMRGDGVPEERIKEYLKY